LNNNLKEIEFFPWNENFETNIEEIDEQHKMLVELLNKLGNALLTENVQKMEKVFDELAKYADHHFYCEELVWAQYFDIESPLVKNHKKTHDSFIPKVLEIQESSKELGLQKILEDILLFLIKWLAFHIIDEDKRLSYIIRYMNEGNNQSEAIFKTDALMNGTMKKLVDTILDMYNSISSKAIDLIKERKARIKAEEELQKINKKLEKLSITDQLTNLYNRRYFEEVFDKNIRICIREKKYLGVILFDIDYFKKLNDTYGHQKGDIALKSIAKCMKEVTKRPTDYVFRLGGEEFCIVTSSDNQEEAYNLSKILHENIKELKIANKNSLVNEFLTISTGVVSIIPSKKDNLDSIMLEVDKKLYSAKENGRNRIIY